MAGDVVAVGEGVDTLAVGDRVLAMPWLGGFASHVELAAAGAVPDPRGAHPTARPPRSCRATARCSSPSRSAPRSAAGEWVLVLGAGGGIGLAAVDVARHLGARVIAARLHARQAGRGHRRRRRGHDQLRGRGPEGAGPGDLRRRRRRGGRPGRRPLRRPRAAVARLDGPLPRHRLRRRRDPAPADQPGAAEQPHDGRRRLGRVDDARCRRQPGPPGRAVRAGRLAVPCPPSSRRPTPSTTWSAPSPTSRTARSPARSSSSPDCSCDVYATRPRAIVAGKGSSARLGPYPYFLRYLRR